jgi:lipopolysaccharide biosynthesis glycosyltransferase
MQPTVLASRAALHRNAVVFCADECYLPYALFAADQLHRTAAVMDFDIVICAPEGTVIPDTLTHLDIRLSAIQTQGLFDGLYLDGRRTEAVYHRLALPLVFAGDYDRLLYLDSDIFVHGGDFSRLFGIDFGDHAIAAVRDNYQWTKPNRQMQDFANVGLEPAKYFNSGVMLMDVDAYQSQKILEQCITFGRANSDKLRQHDQELLNCVLHGNWSELSPVWNWQQPIRSAYYETMQPVVITHFIGPCKPWQDPDGLLPPRFAIAFRAFLNRHFPNMDTIQVAKGSKVSRAYITKLTIKNFLRAGRLQQYLRRFPDDMLTKT